MGLTDKLTSINDKILNILLGDNSDIDLSDKVIERKERLIQTYIVVFGLLIAYDGDAALQKLLMYLFMFFLLLSIIYYTSISHPSASENSSDINILSWFIAFFFSLSLIICMYKFTIPSSTLYSWILPSQLLSMQFVKSLLSFFDIIQLYALLFASFVWGLILTIVVAFSLRV